MSGMKDNGCAGSIEAYQKLPNAIVILAAKDYRRALKKLSRQVASLHGLAAKANSTLTDMPGSPNRNIHRMEDIIVKIVDLENEINHDIDTLVDLKTEIMQVIKQVEDLESQTLLEQRYLNFRTWEQIAVDMGYNVRHLYRMHDKALKAVKVPKVVT